MSPFRHHRIAPILIGGLLISAGFGIVGNAVYQRLQSNQEVGSRASNDQSAIGSWNHGGSNKLAGAPGKVSSTSSAAAATPAGCGGAADPQAYALLKFSSLTPFGYAGVAVDGNWDNLHDRSMVHWHGSADPGGTGNAIIAFHREPNYEHVDQLKVGGIISIQDRTCRVYEYKVTLATTLSPDKVTQLVQTTGHDLTLITCTPWWQDYNRLVWRASLVSVDGTAFTA